MAKIIAVAGSIGSGKTSLVRWLAEHYDLEPTYEPHEENPYLVDFYGDMKRWAFHAQLFFLARRLELHREIERKTRPCILDRTLYEDAEIFAENLFRNKCIEKRDYAIYASLYESAKRSLRPPDVLIALHCSVKTAKKRIALRGREMEKNLDTAYLSGLRRSYERFFANYTLSPVVHIETDRLDYVENLIDLIELRTRVARVVT